jgi:signal transduction histidine kinase
LPDDKINALLPGAGSELWIGTDNGLARWNGVEVTRAGLPGPLDHVGVLAMARDRASNVWIGTASGELLRINGSGVASFDPQDRMRRGAVSAVFEDRDGNLWIGTSRGIERLRDGAFTTYSSAQGLPDGSYGPVYAGAERTWFAGLEGGLYWMQGSHVEPVQQAGLAGDVVYSIAGGPDGEVWVGRQHGGLTRLRVTGDGVSAVTFTQRDGLAQNNVYAVHHARDGAVWAGTLSGGVSRFKDGVFTTFTTADGLPSNTVAAILESADGRIWLATPTGVAAQLDKGWQRFATSDGLPSDEINTLFEDSVHDVWVGTSAGLATIREGRVVPLQLPAELRAPVLGIAEDRLGWLWIVTNEHLMRVNREHLAAGSLTTGDLRDYTTLDGLLGREGVKRHRSVAIDPRGRIWLAMNRGLSMADPARLDVRGLDAPVHVEDLTADGRALDRRGDVRVPSGRQRVTLSYTGINLGGPERVLFRSRLDGFDHDWSEPSTARQVTYTNLAPGGYRFHVIASNGDGLWGATEAALAFTVAPAWWQTSWFRLSAIAGLAAMGWGLYRVRVRQVARQLNVRFEERLAERTRIAQELHDTLLQGFLSASMQLHVVADRLPEDSPAKPPLARVLDLMRRVIDEGRNAVRGLRSTSSPLHDLEQAFSGISGELGGGKQPEYRVIVEGRARPLNPIIRDEVYRIGREALVNAFRHADAERVELELEYGSSALRMLVRDNGRGIDEHVLQAGSDGHWGLPGMRERAQRIGARFKVWSRPEAGTEIELSVPGHIAFRDAVPHREKES